MEIDVSKFLDALFEATADNVDSFVKPGEWKDPIILVINLKEIECEFEFFEECVRIETETEPFEILYINAHDMIAPNYVKNQFSIYAQFKQRIVDLGEAYINKTIQKMPI